MKLTGLVAIRGGGDLASGVALRLYHSGIKVLITELTQPLNVRRYVSFGEAVYQGTFTVEGVTAVLAGNSKEARNALAENRIPVMVDPSCEICGELEPLVMIDARMTKRYADADMQDAPLVIGLGPGFTAGENCHVVIETNRGHFLGRVIRRGSAQPDTGLPETVLGKQAERVLRAPADGVLAASKSIGEHVEQGETILKVDGVDLTAPFTGVLRGLLHDGVPVRRGMKIGDLDPRDDPAYAKIVSEKSLAIGGGVLEAILSDAEIRKQLWT